MSLKDQFEQKSIEDQMEVERLNESLIASHDIISKVQNQVVRYEDELKDNQELINRYSPFFCMLYLLAPPH
jgi:hypothetical protein